MAMTAETVALVPAGQGAGREAESSLVPHENHHLMEQSHLQQIWVLQNFFRVENPARYLRDSICRRLVNLVMSMMQFQVHYQFLVNYIGGGIGQINIEASGGENLPERLNGMTFRSLAERLKKGMEQQHRDFCESFKSLQSSLQMGATKAEKLIKMQQRRPEGGPVPPEKLQRALRLEDLRAAVECLTRPKAEMLEDARFFLDTASAHLSHSNMAQDHVLPFHVISAQEAEGEDYTAADHMMAARLALQSLAEVVDVVSQDWASELDSLIDVFDALMSARTLDEQKEADLKQDIDDYIQSVPLMRLAFETPSLQMPTTLPRVLLNRPSAGARRNPPHVPLLPTPLRAQALPGPELATETEA